MKKEKKKNITLSFLHKKRLFFLEQSQGVSSLNNFLNKVFKYEFNFKKTFENKEDIITVKTEIIPEMEFQKIIYNFFIKIYILNKKFFLSDYFTITKVKNFFYLTSNLNIFEKIKNSSKIFKHSDFQTASEDKEGNSQFILNLKNRNLVKDIIMYYLSVLKKKGKI